MGQIQAQIERVIASWASRQPSFLWAPTSRDKLLLDRARGLKGRAIGKAAAIQPGGITTLIPNSGDSWIEFPTNAGVTSGTTPFIGVMLVSVKDPAAVTGSFLKIGSDSDGLGFGAGNTTFENSGTKGIILQEGWAWNVGPANFLAAGLNFISFGITPDLITAYFCHTTQLDASIGVSGTISPSAQLRINGYFANRGSNVKVHAVAIFPKSLDATTTSAFQAERERLFAPARALQRISRSAVDALFVPQERRLIVAGGGAPAAYTLTADAGSYGLTGVSAGLLAARKVVADAGAYSLTGVDAALSFARKLAADAGAYSLAGQDANLLATRALAADAGAYTLTGQDAALLAARMVSAETGAYVLTGQDAGLLAARVVVAEAGAYDLTGQDAGLVVGRAMQAETGAYVLTGSAAGLIYTQPGAYTLAAESGTYALTGVSAGLLATRSLTADVGAYALTGVAADLIYTPVSVAYTLTAESGAYVLTGAVADFRRTFQLAAAAGSYALSGKPATLTYSGAVVDGVRARITTRRREFRHPDRAEVLSTARRPRR